jgi:hypothetical protein
VCVCVCVCVYIYIYIYIINIFYTTPQVDISLIFFNYRAVRNCFRSDDAYMMQVAYREHSTDLCYISSPLRSHLIPYTASYPQQFLLLLTYKCTQTTLTGITLSSTDTNDSLQFKALTNKALHL